MVFKKFKKSIWGFAILFAILFSFVTLSYAKDVTLAWDANTESNLAGYKIYYDTDCSGEPYDGAGAVEGVSPIDVGNITEFTLHGLSDGDAFFFVVTAYNDEGLESGYSNEVSTQCSLTLNVAGSGNVSVDPDGGNYDVGTEVTLTAQAASGWQFSEWSGDFPGSGNPAIITMDSDKIVTANFIEVPTTQYSLTVNTSGSGSVTLDPAGGTYDEGTEVTLTAQAVSGRQFSGWSGDFTGSVNPASITMDSNKTVTATFTHTQTLPVINSFTATPGIITEGDFVTLEWSITGADSATISNGVGAVAPSGGSVQDAPVNNTTYTITATNSYSSVTASVTVTVVQGEPVINSFKSTHGTINKGKSVTLSWNITGAETASINNGVGAVSPTTGSVQVSPICTKTYTLTATNNGVLVNSMVTVIVVQPSPVISSFTSTHEKINQGESATLSWSIVNGDSAIIDNSIGSVDPVSGSLEVSPLSTSTYKLTATNSGGSVTGTVTIMVSEVLPPEIVETIPHDGAGINDNERVPNTTSFCVRIEDSEGIDITDITSIRFTIDDNINEEYTRDLSDSIVVRVVKLTDEDDSQLTKLWAVYDRSEEYEFGDYDYGTHINIKVDVKGRVGLEMAQESYFMKIETQTERKNAEVVSPSTTLLELSDPALEDPEYIYDSGIRVKSGALAGATIVYDSSEPVQPRFGPTEEIPGLEGVGEGAPMNLQPPNVFNTPVKLFIPYPEYSDVSHLSIFLYTGNRWVLACDANGNVLPGGEGWMVPGSRVNHNNGNPSTIEIKVYHFTGVLAGNGAHFDGTSWSGGACFIDASSHGYLIETQRKSFSKFVAVHEMSNMALQTACSHKVLFVMLILALMAQGFILIRRVKKHPDHHNLDQ